MADEPVNWRAFRERGCGTKVCYPGPSSARGACLTIEENTGETMRPYRCPWEHHGWHIGHPLSAEGLADLAAALRARKIEEDGGAHLSQK